MKNETKHPAGDFIKGQVLIMERNQFMFRVIATLVAYVGLTLLLNAIRAATPLWLLWALIIIQFALYFSLFTTSYQRAVVCGLSRGLGTVIFVALAVLGRVNNWELVVIPLMLVIMLVVSASAKNLSAEGEILMPESSSNQ